MPWWQALDAELFYRINSGLTNPVFDLLLPWIRDKWFWAPLYLFLLAFVRLNLSRRDGLVFLFGLVLAVGVSDFTSSTLIKKNVQRLRPCREPSLEHSVQMRVPCGGGYSFTSSHASNHFAVATYVVLTLGAGALWMYAALYTWAFLISFAQVYVGVHYPGDVVIGALLGVFVGQLIYYLFKRLKWDTSYP